MKSTTGTIHRPQAGERAQAVRASLGSCRLCAHVCGADRYAPVHCSPRPCGAGIQAWVFSVALEIVGEAALVPTATVAFAGCSWRCQFCLTGERSQDAAAGQVMDVDALVTRILAMPGLQSVTIEGGEPLVHLAEVLDLIARLPMDLPVVFKTNAAAGTQALAWLEGQVQVVLADLKFGNPACARELAGTDHQEAVWQTLRWAHERGLLIVRHLLMPGHRECCTRSALGRLAAELPGCRLSLMTGFLPAFQAAAMGSNTPAEVAAARALAAALPLALEPWALAPVPGFSSGGECGLWIAADGRIGVDRPDADLLQALQRIAHEVRIGP